MAFAAIELLVAAELALGGGLSPLRSLRVTSRFPPTVLGSFADGGFATWSPDAVKALGRQIWAQMGGDLES